MPMLEKSRGASQVQAEGVAAAGKSALQSFVFENAAPDTDVYTESTRQQGLSPVVDLTALQENRNAMLGHAAIHFASLSISTISSMENATNQIHIQLREMLS